MFIAGDLNWDYRIDENIYMNNVYKLEPLYGLKQLISEPIRVTRLTPTLIDVLLSS